MTQNESVGSNFTFIPQNPKEFFFNQFWPALMDLDPVAIALLGILVILLFVVLFVVVKLFAWILSLLKRFILFFFVVISLGGFLLRFKEDLLAEPPNYSLIAVGVFGAIFAVIALVISILSLKKYWAETRALKAGVVKEGVKEAVEEEQKEELEQEAMVDASLEITPTQVQQPQLFTKQALDPRNLRKSLQDRSLLAVLSYIIVAEFGVFSSVTIAAPNSTVGFGFFVAFMLAAFIFIKTTYYSYAVGLGHLAVGAIFGMVLSIGLGHLWVGTPLELLLSLEYFATNSLVAFITGLAVSLFMGSKG
jgi:ABC-type multidrug transport system fused ATPase/permease subunit